MLQLKQPPTAFLCSSIAQATGVRKIAVEKNLMIGKDISIIAHDDMLHALRADSFDPPLTTTQSPIAEGGRRLVQLLVSGLTGDSTTVAQEVLPVDLIVRASTGPVAN
jgi:LacI family transcriptional regulator